MEAGKKLPDITSSEGNLSRFSYICRKVREAGYVDERKLYNICRETGIGNPKVIGRHIHIMKILNLVLKQEELYYVSSYGKVVSAFFKEMKHLTKEEKAIFFQLFFRNIYAQLYNLLKVIRDNENNCNSYEACFALYTISYFSLPEIMKIWNQRTLVKTIELYRTTGKLRRGIENKFETMLEWLANLDLIYKDQKIGLSRTGHKAYQGLSTGEPVDLVSLYILRENLKSVDLSEDYDVVRSGYVQSIEAFTNPEGMADINAINLYVQVRLAADHGLYMNEKAIENTLSKLQEEKIVRSFILDRKGKLSIIQVK
jgi:hypothetical protein